VDLIFFLLHFWKILYCGIHKFGSVPFHVCLPIVFLFISEVKFRKNWICKYSQWKKTKGYLSLYKSVYYRTNAFASVNHVFVVEFIHVHWKNRKISINVFCLQDKTDFSTVTSNLFFYLLRFFTIWTLICF
jgi:hypothetical protein